VKGGFRFGIDADEILLVRRLVGEVRQLLESLEPGDAKMHRLFPPAYTDDDEKNLEYQRLMRDELVASRVADLQLVDELLNDATPAETTPADTTRPGPVVFDATRVEALARSVNSVRLVLGSLLGLDDEDDDHHRWSGRPEYELYQFLSWVLDGAVDALMQG
jgi:hypothetical protein